MIKLCILGGGFIGRFYAESLIGRRGKDEVKVVYARREETAVRFAKDYNVPHFLQIWRRLLPIQRQKW